MNDVLEDEVMETLEALQRVLPKTEWVGTQNNSAGCWGSCEGSCTQDCLVCCTQWAS